MANLFKFIFFVVSNVLTREIPETLVWLIESPIRIGVCVACLMLLRGNDIMLECSCVRNIRGNLFPCFRQIFSYSHKWSNEIKTTSITYIYISFIYSAAQFYVNLFLPSVNLKYCSASPTIYESMTKVFFIFQGGCCYVWDGIIEINNLTFKLLTKSVLFEFSIARGGVVERFQKTTRWNHNWNFLASMLKNKETGDDDAGDLYC